MGSVNIVVGLSGVGKTSVLKKTIEQAEADYQLINYGDRMLELAKEQNLVENRDEMKDIESGTYKEIQMDAAESIVKDSKEGDVIVDTHAAIKSPFGYIPGLPKWTLENLTPDKIVIVDIDAETIVQRRKEDLERERTADPVEEIEEYREVAREMAAAGSVHTGAYLKIIRNEDGKVDEAAEELLTTLNN